MHYAACQRNRAIAHELLRAGAAVDARTRGGTSPLHVAAAVSHSCCQLLLLAGADANVLDIREWAPLHYAASSGLVDCAVLLLAAGADPRRKSAFGEAPADVAAVYGHAAAASLLRDAAGAAARWGGLRRAVLSTWCRAC